MTTYTENMKAVKEVALRASFARKAVEMGAQGYDCREAWTQVDHDGSVHSAYGVHKPEGGAYTVYRDAQTDGAETFSCTCPACQEWGDCKHIQFVRYGEAQAARLDAMTEEEYYSRW